MIYTFDFSFYVLLSLPFLTFITVFGFLAFRTSVEMYAIEKTAGTIEEVKRLVDELGKVSFFNKVTNIFFTNKKGRNFTSMIFLFIILWSIIVAWILL